MSTVISVIHEECPYLKYEVNQILKRIIKFESKILVSIIKKSKMEFEKYHDQWENEVEELCRMKFHSYDDLIEGLENWSLKYYHPINIRSCQLLESYKGKTEYSNDDVKKFVKKYITYKCVHATTRNGSECKHRPNTKTNQIDCKFNINISLNIKNKCFEFNKFHAYHNHLIGERYYKNLAFNRR